MLNAAQISRNYLPFMILRQVLKNIERKYARMREEERKKRRNEGRKEIKEEGRKE